MKGWIVIWILLLLWGCSKPSVPDQYMQEEELAEILLDIYIAEGKIDSDLTHISSSKIYPVYREYIFEKHGITDSVYNANMAYYLTHPEFFDKVYEIVIDSMQVKRQRLSN